MGMQTPAPTAPPSAEGSPTPEAREVSGITSRLILAYLEREGGRHAVDAVLQRCGLEEKEADLRDEDQWFSRHTKMRLFEAAAEVLEDPRVTLHLGEAALELGVGQTFKATLRALGSPTLVYRNVGRANARVVTTHSMELLHVARGHARVRCTSADGVEDHRLDCDYSIGMLASIPALFGLPLARVSHPVCAVDGADACLYEISWEAQPSGAPFFAACAATGAGAVALTALAAPVALPAGVAVAGAAAVAAVWRARGLEHRRWRALEHGLRDQAVVGERLSGSLQDLAGELRLDDVVSKIALNAQRAVRGKQFALLLPTPSGAWRCRSSSGLPPASSGMLERWMGTVAGRLHAPLTLDDARSVPELAAATNDQSLPLRSLCAVPLVLNGHTLGVLVALAGAPKAFLPNDVELLSAYGVHAAIALSNAHVFEAQGRLAARDPLTGLLNRRELHEEVQREVDRCRRHGGRWSLVLLDLDGFKLVNDGSGHSEGDDVLQRVAQVVADSCRASDLAFRVGGDEFALVLPETPERSAAAASAERVRELIVALDPRLGASYGVAVWPDDGAGADALLIVADRRLYRMKGARSPAYFASRTTGPDAAEARRRQRLAVASRLSSRLAPLQDQRAIVETTVAELHRGFGYFLAVIHRVDPDGMLRLVSAKGEMVEQMTDRELWTQSVHVGVNGRVARSGEPALVADTAADPDFLVPAGAGKTSRSELAMPIRVDGRIWGVLNLESDEPNAFDADDLLLADTVAAQVGSALHLSELFEGIESTFTTTLAVLCDALEAKDAYAAARTLEVSALAERVAVRLGIRGDDLRSLRYASLLHDIGKIAVRSEILNKPGGLTDEEFEEMEQHTVASARMLERIPGLESVVPLVRAAHERWDGSGYPDGLARSAISLGARVICACDAYYAMLSDRPHRPALPVSEAMLEMRRGEGSQFDAMVVDALVAEIEESG